MTMQPVPPHKIFFPLFFFTLWQIPIVAQESKTDERGNMIAKPATQEKATSRKFHAGIEFSATAHNEGVG